TLLTSCFLKYPSSYQRSPLSLHDALPISTSRPTAAGSKSPWRRSRDGASRSWVKSRSSPVSHAGIGTLKPRLRPSTTASEASTRSEEHTSELQSRGHLVCRLLLEKKKKFQ